MKDLPHSEPLKLLIEALCKVDHEIRPRASDLYEWLRPHENKIFELEPFHINQLHSSLLKVATSNNVNPQPLVRNFEQPLNYQ